MSRVFSLVHKAIEVACYEGPATLLWRCSLWARKHWYQRVRRKRDLRILQTASAILPAFPPADHVAVARPAARTSALQPSSSVGLTRVLFVAPIKEFTSMRYRVANLRAHLAIEGIGSHTMWDIDVAQRLEGALKSDLIVFHRTPATPELRCLAHIARARGIRLVFEIDDYLFDSSMLSLIPGLDEGSTGLADQMRTQIKGTEEMLSLCDLFLGSTQFLAQRASQLGYPSYVIPNGLSDRQLALAQHALARRKRPRCDAPVRVGYLAGTRTHRHDFAVVIPALRRLMDEFPHVVLVVRGLMDLPPELSSYRARIERRPYVSWQRLVAATAALDVTLAPLNLSNPVVEGKSALKYFESALVRVPVVASPTEEFRQAIQHGTTSFLASNDEEWYEHLRMLITDPTLRSRIGAQARAHVLATYSTDAQSAHTVRVFTQLAQWSGQRPAG